MSSYKAHSKASAHLRRHSGTVLTFILEESARAETLSASSSATQMVAAVVARERTSDRGRAGAPNMRPRAADQTLLPSYLPSAAMVFVPAVAESRACFIHAKTHSDICYLLVRSNSEGLERQASLVMQELVAIQLLIRPGPGGGVPAATLKCLVEATSLLVL
jgi:hypothetical protein